MKGVTYDTGTLIAAERHDRAMSALHNGFIATKAPQRRPAGKAVAAAPGSDRGGCPSCSHGFGTWSLQNSILLSRAKNLIQMLDHVQLSGMFMTWTGRP